ncbi:39S ribosomal protein L52, mitochondrial isoform X2 [Hemicordylus capensis]|uniref:39S ribosomal protein L52, mitochondrial isoform X2 n=1 Tax=Hemicordylus capensis TaxID=884348 RepID=UPI0023023F3C|nr:39S ribosomal protein L52, mitochondrial isoform X2 [Hemicordylus capensis]
MAAPSAAFFRTIPENSCAWFLALFPPPPPSIWQLARLKGWDLSWYKYPWHRGVSTAALHTRLVAGGERNGRPAPPMKGQLRRQEKNEAFARRAVMLSEEIDHALEKWEAQKREQEQQAEEKRHNRLVPKGSLLRQTSK